MALAESLHHLTMEGHSSVTFAELARQFFLLYRERLQSGRPQLLTPGRQTVMERIMHLVEAGGLTEADAISRIEHEAFGDVVPRFHTVGHSPIDVRFYEATAQGLVLTDALYQVFASASGPELRTEALARWDLLEAAFVVRREHSQLHNDLRRFYISRGYERTDLTPLRPVLHAYQQGSCFYCQEPLDVADSHVDHVIPRQVVYHDEVWNLVLAHSFCNQQKQDLLPGLGFLEKLVARNEHLIASQHPLRNQIVRHLGPTPSTRRESVLAHYRNAETLIGITWEAARGYDPQKDPHLRKMVRLLRRIGYAHVQ